MNFEKVFLCPSCARKVMPCHTRRLCVLQENFRFFAPKSKIFASDLFIWSPRYLKAAKLLYMTINAKSTAHSAIA